MPHDIRILGKGPPASCICKVHRDSPPEFTAEDAEHAEEEHLAFPFSGPLCPLRLNILSAHIRAHHPPMPLRRIGTLKLSSRPSLQPVSFR